MRKLSLNIFLFFFILELSAFAFIKPQRHRSKSHHHHGSPLKEIAQEVLRPETYFASTKVDLKQTNKLTALKRDLLTDKIRLLSGDFGFLSQGAPSLKDYKEHALNFVAHNFETFKLKEHDLKLIPGATYLGDDVQFLQFAIFKENLLVEDASISFRFKQKKLIQITNYGFTEALPEKATSFLQKELEHTLLKETGAKNLSQKEDSFRVEKKGKDYHLKRVSSYKITDRDNIKLNVQIDKATGKIYEQKENNFYLHGKAKAKLYPRWHGDELKETPLPYLNIRQKSYRTLQTNGNGFFNTNDRVKKIYLKNLDGKYATIINKNGNDISAKGKKSSDLWLLDLMEPESTKAWLDTTTAQYMVYYHITKVLDHVSQYIKPEWFKKPLVATTNNPKDCNAHWDAREGTINLYSGSAPSEVREERRCANTGLISDIIYHEWGHGLDANTGGIQDRAFSEGIGDIISLLMTRSHLIGVGFRLIDNSPVRDLKPDKIYPQDRGEVHHEGLIIGSTFWDLYEALSKRYNPDKAIDLLSQYLLKGLYTARTYLELYDAILVIDDDDNDLENGSPNTCLINKVFAKHGLAKKLSSCTLVFVEELSLLDENKNNLFEPGESIKLFVKVKNPSSKVLENLKGTVSYESMGLNIFQKTLEWEPIPPHSSRVNSVPAELQIRDDVACGTNISFNLKLSSGTKESSLKGSFTVGENKGQEEFAKASDLPKKIEDYQITRSSLKIKDPEWAEKPPIHKAILKFSLTHGHIGDLSIHLISPEGAKFLVFKDKKRGQKILFHEDITEKLKSVRSSEGTWFLEVEDGSFRDGGTLESFSLTLTPKLFRCEEP